MAGRGGDGTGDDHLDQQVREASDTCLYSFVRIAVAGGGDTALETSVDSAIKMASYDRSSGTKFIIDTHDGHHVELTWQPPASKPDIVDFSGLLKYTAQGGNMRSLCVMGRMLDAFQYPVENYFPFVATTGVEATAAGECTTSAVSVTISGCVSEGYNIR